MTLQEKLCRLRSREGLSQEDVAEKLNVSRQSVSKWETGQSVPELDKLLALSELYCVSLDDLVRDERDPFKGSETEVPLDNTPKGERNLKQIRKKRGLAVLMTGVGMFFFALLLSLLGGGSTALLVVCFYGGIGIVIIGAALLLFWRFHPAFVIAWAFMFGMVLFDWLCGWSVFVLLPQRSIMLLKNWWETKYFAYALYGFQFPYLFVLTALSLLRLWQTHRKEKTEETV